MPQASPVPRRARGARGGGGARGGAGDARSRGAAVGAAVAAVGAAASVAAAEKDARATRGISDDPSHEYEACEAIGDGLRGEFWKAKHENITVLELDYEPLQVLLTRIRDRECDAKAFNFYVHRLLSLTIELSLGSLPTQDAVVTTPEGYKFKGKEYVHGRKLMAVSVSQSSGAHMIEPLQRLAPDIPVAKAKFEDKDDPTSLQLSSGPSNMGDYNVIILCPIVRNGSKLDAVIKQLVKNGAAEENIMIVSLFITPKGADLLARGHPDVQCIAASIDAGIDDDNNLVPGVGDFERRYTEDSPTYVAKKKWSLFG